MPRLTKTCAVAYVEFLQIHMEIPSKLSRRQFSLHVHEIYKRYNKSVHKIKHRERDREQKSEKASEGYKYLFISRWFNNESYAVANAQCVNC
jgi:hypothetical protein